MDTARIMPDRFVYTTYPTFMTFALVILQNQPTYKLTGPDLTYNLILKFNLSKISFA